jgi:hypothetical protein
MAARSDLVDSISLVAQQMEKILCRVTGLDSFARKLIIYYTLATHALKHLKTFPLLVLKGPMGTGKSNCLQVIAAFARQPNPFSLRGRTLAAIREELVKCDDGTAIIEEADQAWKDAAFESILSDRYQRATAQTALRVPALPGLPKSKARMPNDKAGMSLKPSNAKPLRHARKRK